MQSTASCATVTDQGFGAKNVKFVHRSFGGKKGILTTAKFAALGYLGAFRHLQDQINPNTQRLVFVCRGNICRSPFAERVARLNGIPTTSFGLRTTTGNVADPLAIATSAQLGIDMADHVATRVTDFDHREGDMIVAFEPAHCNELIDILGPDSSSRICLLGFWLRPRLPHLQDPFDRPAYFETCFKRIRRAVNLISEAPVWDGTRAPRK